MEHRKTPRVFTPVVVFAAVLSMGITAKDAAAAQMGTLYCNLSPAVLAAGGEQSYSGYTKKQSRGRVQRLEQLGVPVKGSVFDVGFESTIGVDGQCYWVIDEE